MRSNDKVSLWTNSNRSRYFLIPDDQELPDGDFILCTLKGHEKKVDYIALNSFEITDSEAKAYLQAEMNQAMEEAKNAFASFMSFSAEATQEAPSNPTSSFDQTSSYQNIIFALLGVTLEELQNNPESAQTAFIKVYTELKELLGESTSQSPAQVDTARERVRSLREMLQAQGINVSEGLEELPDKIREVFSSRNIEQYVQEIVVKLRDFTNEINQSPEVIGLKIDEAVQSLSKDLFIDDQEKRSLEERKQKHNKLAQDAIAESFRSLGIPSFAGDDLQLDTSQEGEFTVNTSSQTDIQLQETTPQKESHILSLLTPEEIAQFYQVSQMVAPYQRKKVQEITEKLKSLIITRIGELGEETFTRASTFFLEVKLEAKNFKLIQRYSRLAGRTRLLLQSLNDWSEQHGELPANSQGRIALVELDQLFWRIDKRLQELPANKYEGQQEVNLLIEIEELREKLAHILHLEIVMSIP